LQKILREINTREIMMEPYRITIEEYEMKFSIEVNHSDISWDQYISMLESISRAAGWGEDKIIELFG